MGKGWSKLDMVSIDTNDPYKYLIKNKQALAKGAFGAVYCCHRRGNKSLVCAVKEVNIPSNKRDNRELNRIIDREESVVGRLIQLEDHPNILKIYFCTRTVSNFSIFMEYLDGGDLHDFITENGAQPAEKMFIFLIHILKGLQFLHSNQIAHYDMKSSNILLDKSEDPTTIKICDYGMSKNFSSEYDISQTVNYRGTVLFMAPEVVDCLDNSNKEDSEKSTFSRKSDIWSVGVIGLHLISGKLPSLTVGVLNELTRYETNNQQNQSAIDVLKSLLVINPLTRCCVGEAIKLIKNNIPEIIYAIDDAPPELESKLINHFLYHHNDDNVIKLALQIIRSFHKDNWYAVSCNIDADVSWKSWIFVKVHDRKHLFCCYLYPKWKDATEESVESYLNSIELTTKSAWEVSKSLECHFSGMWHCVISSNNDTIVYNNINVTLNNGIKFITVCKWWN